MQSELSDQYLQYREERDARRLLIWQLSDRTRGSAKEEESADEASYRTAKHQSSIDLPRICLSRDRLLSQTDESVSEEQIQVQSNQLTAPIDSDVPASSTLTVQEFRASLRTAFPLKSDQELDELVASAQSETDSDDGIPSQRLHDLIDVSCLTWEGQQFQGKRAIVDKLNVSSPGNFVLRTESLPFTKIAHSITAQDHQPTPDCSILSMVIGQLKSFILKNINDAWVCTNDMFRLAIHNFG
ncbi:Nuclear transport factor 2 [Nibea albiflora]|uniref:Nuclear transport factor 2 n=1 Tax=Nibea albiflora TaxID=240163 RepID=A0ACB7FFJ4_NIBAL|nr:Nuclear transport factor 2 [Nibea albiflora]